MSFANTPTSYGLVNRIIHWTTALVIFVAFPIGFVANRLPIDTNAEIAQKFELFSVHKTLGIVALGLGLLRLAWSLAGPRPAPVSPERRVETFLAATTHHTLTLSLVLVPLSGWISHAATSGLAPIWWPFGQTLPFVPRDDRVAVFVGGVHWVATKLLAIAVVLHVAGALKHAIFEKDGVLARMVAGRPAGPGLRRRSRLPITAALVLWAVALGLGAQMGVGRIDRLPAPPPPDWPVSAGTVSVALAQGGTTVTGDFLAWSATMSLADSSQATGQLDITIPLDSLDAGDATDTILGPQFLNSQGTGLATYSGTISGSGNTLTSNGKLELNGTATPENLAVTLHKDGKGATISGSFPAPGLPALTFTIDLQATSP